MQTKKCNTCKEVLPFEAFNKAKRRPDGYANRCRKCTKLYINARNTRVKELNIQNFGAEVPAFKLCYKCGRTLSIQMFSKNVWKKDQHSEICKDCMSKYHKERYHTIAKESKKRTKEWAKNNKDKVYLRNKQNIIIRKNLINKYKKANGCYFCGESNPTVLDFHHKDPSKKDYSVSNMVGGSEDKMWKEVKKCIVVCSNCHRKLHAGEIHYNKT